ncbi:hypothetical protein C8R42DRAFT_311017 [Lentinula raphanica]|nr:hypothetical protein C8R42DRAFT_311017 [Lentinula raphanica]
MRSILLRITHYWLALYSHLATLCWSKTVTLRSTLSITQKKVVRLSIHQSIPQNVRSTPLTFLSSFLRFPRLCPCDRFHARTDLSRVCQSYTC